MKILQFVIFRHFSLNFPLQKACVINFQHDFPSIYRIQTYQLNYLSSTQLIFLVILMITLSFVVDRTKKYFYNTLLVLLKQKKVSTLLKNYKYGNKFFFSKNHDTFISFCTIIHCHFTSFVHKFCWKFINQRMSCFMVIFDIVFLPWQEWKMCGKGFWEGNSSYLRLEAGKTPNPDINHVFFEFSSLFRQIH